MPKQYEGKLDGSGLRMALVVGRFNSFISERLVDGALDAFAVFRRMCDVVSVRAEAVADDLRKDVGPAPLRMFF